MRRPPDPRRAQALELVGVDHRVGVAVGVHEQDLAASSWQRALDDRDHRRDPAAAGEGDDRRRVSCSTNRPAGRITSIVVAGARVSFIQFDITPVGTRFTAVLNGSPASGELDIE